jgi:AcrR family transcriptional regulator
MTMRPPPRRKKDTSEPLAKRRRYDSPLRRQQAAETRERIIAGGAELVHGFPAWDWRGLTFRAVGERAGVTERTVHRHFSTERALREAVLHRLVEESGIRVEGLELGDFAGIAAQLFTYLSSFAVSPRPLKDPAFATVDQHRRDALLGAVVRSTRGWSASERQMAAAMLDMLWSVPTYERLLTAWRLDAERAIRAITWVVGLIEEAIRKGRRSGLSG